MEKIERNGYYFHKAWFEFLKKEAEKAIKDKDIKPIHTALYCHYVQVNNKAGWHFIRFLAPTDFAMKTLGIGNRNTFKAAFQDLVNWGFVKLSCSSPNQYTAREIILCTFNNEQAEMNRPCTSNASSSEHIDKPLNYLNSEIEEEEFLLKKDFENFDQALSLYVGSKAFNVFKKKYNLDQNMIIERFGFFWEYQDAFDQLTYTIEDFKHFYKWHPKELKSSEENSPRLPEWKANHVKISEKKEVYKNPFSSK